MKVKEKFWTAIAILACGSSGSIETFGQERGCSLPCERALVVNVEGPIKIPNIKGPTVLVLPAEAQLNQVLDRYQQAAQLARFQNAATEFVFKFGESYSKLLTERLGPYGPGVDAAVGFSADRLKEYLKEETDNAVRTVLRADLNRIEAVLAGRSDPEAISEALTTVLGPRIKDVTDPIARAEINESATRMVADGLDQLRSEHRASDAETAKAIKDLAGRITRLSQETRKVMASVEQLKEELKRQGDLLNQLVEANRPPPPEVIARQRSGERLQVIGNTLIQAGNVLRTLGVDQDVYSAAMTSGTVLTIAGRAFSGTLTPDVVLEGINSILGLFSSRPDPIQLAIRDAVRQILDALAEMDRRNQERFLALVRQIERLETQVIEVQLGVGSLLYTGLGQCKLLLPERLRSGDVWLNQIKPDYYRSRVEFSSNFKSASIVHSDCKSAIQNTFIIAPAVNDGLADRFAANEIRYRLSTDQGGILSERAKSSTKDFFKVWEASTLLSSDVLMPEILPVSSNLTARIEDIDRLIAAAANPAKCIRQASGDVSACNYSEEWRAFWRNYGIIVDGQAVDAAVRLGGGLLPFYEFVDASGKLLTDPTEVRTISAANRPIVLEILKGMELISAVSAAQANALSGTIMLPILRDVLAGGWANLTVTCKQADEKKPNVRSCDAITPYAFLVNQEAISERKGPDDESAREMTRKSVVALLNGVTNPPDMFRRPNFLLKKNLSLYIVAGSLRGAGWKLALYELARKYQGSPRLIETALKLPDGYKVVAAQGASENGSVWTIAVNEVQFELPSAQELIDGMLASSPSQLRLAATRGLVDKMRTEYIYIPKVMTDRDRVALARIFNPGSKELPSSAPRTLPPPTPPKKGGKRASIH